jgi:uncharacterized protein (TIGR02284 family)
MTMDNHAAIDTLNDLIENCRDGEYGFQTCAEHAQSGELKTYFAQRARDCATAAQELQELVTRLGGTPDAGGSASGAVHRGWVAVRGTLALNDDKAMLEECERGEDAAVARYRAALDSTLPPEIESVVLRQYQGAQRNHDEVKRLRNSVQTQTA